ncbi:MAG: hypothetical protein AAF367_04225 [Pseudomonadota bacterium]
MPKTVETICEELEGATAFGPFQNAQSIELAVFDAMFDMNSGESIIVSKEGTREWYVYIKS